MPTRADRYCLQEIIGQVAGPRGRSEQVRLLANRSPETAKQRAAPLQTDERVFRTDLESMPELFMRALQSNAVGHQWLARIG